MESGVDGDAEKVGQAHGSVATFDGTNNQADPELVNVDDDAAKKVDEISDDNSLLSREENNLDDRCSLMSEGKNSTAGPMR